MVTTPTLSDCSAQLHSSVQYLTEHWDRKYSKTHFRFFFLLSQSFFFSSTHRRWLASHPWREHGCSHHLRVQMWSSSTQLFTPIYLSLMWGNNNGQQNRRTGMCQHAEHCTLFWHYRNACFPTQGLDTKHVLTTVLLDDNREVYVIHRLCNQKISAPIA